MVGSPLGRRCKAEEKHVEGPLPIAGQSPVLSSKKDAQLLKKKNSAFSTRVSSPTISSSIRANTVNQKGGYPVQVTETKPSFRKGSESQPMKMTQVKHNPPAPRRAPLPPVAKIKKTSAPPQEPQEKVPIQTSIQRSQPAARLTNSALQKNSSKTQPSQQKTGGTPVRQSRSQKAPTTQLSRSRTHNQNSVSQSEPSKQYVRSSVTQKTSNPPRDSASNTRILPDISRSKSSTIEKEPIHHIVWEGPDETFHSSITCALCEKDVSVLPDEYAEEYYDDVEPSVLPTVAILPCGHSFHSVCLDGVTPEENSADPPCFFCLSCMS